MRRIIPYLPLLLVVTGCATMEAMGLWDTGTGTPTPQGDALNSLVRGLTGLDVLDIWGGVKGVTTLGTKRGRDNLKAAFSPKAGLKGTAQALSAILLGTHTPEAARRTPSA